MKTIAFDFDGVIHKYTKGWQDGSIYDELDMAMIDLIQKILDRGHSVFIMSTRKSKQIKNHFDSLNNYPAPDLITFKYQVIPWWHFSIFWNKKGVVGITRSKKAFSILIDDRAFRYQGNFSAMEKAINKEILGGGDL